MSAAWSPVSWVGCPLNQAIEYRDGQELANVLKILASAHPLVTKSETDVLRHSLAAAADGKGFIIQGGDCAEAFHDVCIDKVSAKRSLLQDQAAILETTLQVPVVCIGRIAGQYAKPRSVCKETLSCGMIVDTFRGDNVNGPGKTQRSPNPQRLLLGHRLAAATMSMLKIAEAEATTRGTVTRTVFTSHEALCLPLEASLTRDSLNVGAHMLWIGERTRQLKGAHVEYIRGVSNPIGIKIGPGTKPSDLVDILNTVDPQRLPGRMTLIARLGANRVSEVLPDLVRAVQAEKRVVVWLCDPCHGNTVTTKNGTKTRIVEVMSQEVVRSYDVHESLGSRLAGLHLEQTGEADITECVDSTSQNMDAKDFGRYRSLCDPRLSRDQALRVVKDLTLHIRSKSAPKERELLGKIESVIQVEAIEIIDEAL